MADIYVYTPNETDFDNFGRVGALVPTSATITIAANKPAELTLVHPYDEWNKYTALQCGAIIKCPMPVRTCPEIDGGTYVTTVETWTVKATATKAQRGVYSKVSGGKRKKTLKPGTLVTVVKKPANADRWKIKTGKTNGWMTEAALHYETTEVLPGTQAGIETAAPAWSARDQLFRVYENPVSDGDDQKITARARQIINDLAGNLTGWSDEGAVAMQDALDGIFDAAAKPHGFEYYTDIADTRVGFDYRDRNILDAIINEDDGVAARFGVELVIDDEELYFLHDAGVDRGMRIAYGENMQGVTWETSYDDLVTCVRPYGQKKDGTRLYLSDDGTDDLVYSDHYGDYNAPYIISLECEGCKIGEGGVTKALARERMREQAEAVFEDHVDLPAMTVDVDFINLGDTEEYWGYRGLETAYLYAPIYVQHPQFGLYQLRVEEMEYDALAKGDGQVTHMTLGVPVKTLQAITRIHLSSLYARIDQRVDEVRAITLTLSPDYATARADAEGNNTDYTNAHTTATVLFGKYDLTDEATFTATAGAGVTGSWDAATRTYTVTGITGNRGTATITATIRGRTASRVFTVDKLLAGMDGVDGDSVEFVFQRTKLPIAPSLVADGVDYGTTPEQTGDFVPGGWTDDPTGVDSTWLYEWVAQRVRSNGAWCAFSRPAVWAKYGENGQDGAGVEQIFARTTTNSAPALTQTSVQTDGNVPSGWSATPLGVSAAYPYGWTSTRKKADGVWGNWSNPVIWAHYAKDGTNGEQGPQGLPGSSGTMVYYSTNTPSGSGYNAGDLWYVLSGGNVAALYRYTGSYWTPIKYDAGAVVVENIVTDSAIARVITAATINALAIYTKRIYSATNPYFNAQIGAVEMNPNSDGIYEDGLYFYSGTYIGGIFVDSILGGIGFGSDAKNTLIIGNELWLQGPNGNKIVIGEHSGSGVQAINIVGDLYPITGNSYTLGGNGDDRRWKKIYANSGTIGTSDERAKIISDMPDLDGFLMSIQPIAYRLKNDPEWLHYGFGAQSIKRTMDEHGVAGDSYLYDGTNPKELGMCYDELIAPILALVQRQQRRIEALERTVERLEQLADISDG